ncbi:hypothetical protein [Halobellus inordinatus]|uniref:hypothetical protein n=1 Tax=Halobellus inordinatus TaxID=1126236 RepID=UPI002113C592|nr:hypothetical protein [Halobellus ramosii]
MTVYSRRTGEHPLYAEVVYWPVGHPEMAKETEGVRMMIEVKETHAHRYVTGTPETPAPPVSPSRDLFSGVLAVLGVVGFAVGYILWDRLAEQ